MSLMSQSYYLIPIPIFKETEILRLSKQRIIQKNLVHFQGFPDRLYDKNLLMSKEYFGQYGKISKIILTNKLESKNNKKSNSAYITFSTYEQAAYAILAVDSIKIDDKLVRAFFGTTKYCHHFLNNYKCLNIDKCMFLHEMAKPSDIIDDNFKFGYSEHIKLAKKIIGFGTARSRIYVINNTCKDKICLPSIETIYRKNDILIKTKNHRKKKSEENSPINKKNFHSNNNETQSSSNSFHSNSSSNELNINNNDIIDNTNFLFNIISNEEEDKNNIFKAKNKSRFNFVNNNINKENTIDSSIVQDIIDELTMRLSFFLPFDKDASLKKLEIEFCNNIYEKTKNQELLNIITNSN